MRFTEDQMTPWFPGTLKPARPGVYEREIWSGGQYSEWTGKFWSLGCNDLNDADNWDHEAYGFQPCKSEVQNARWRGLNFNPEAQ